MRSSTALAEYIVSIVQIERLIDQLQPLTHIVANEAMVGISQKKTFFLTQEMYDNGECS